MSPDAVVTRRVRLSRRLAVDFTLSATEFGCRWDPALPSRLTTREERRYLPARNAVAADLAQQLGISVVIADLTPDGRGISEMTTVSATGARHVH